MKYFKGILLEEQIIIYDTFEPTCEKLRQEGFQIANSLQELVDSSVAILLSVKPQELENVFSQIECDKEIDIISIMAGVNIATIQAKFKNARIARVMPNTCALIGKSASSMSLSKNCGPLTRDFFTDILSSFGIVVQIDESIMDEVIPLAGSFTAYAYYYAKGFIESAVKRGVPEKVAIDLIANSMIGSAEMILKSGKDINTLISDVCSKGGTTLAGLAELEKNDLLGIVDKCSIACANRSKELGKN